MRHDAHLTTLLNIKENLSGVVCLRAICGHGNRCADLGTLNIDGFDNPWCTLAGLRSLKYTGTYHAQRGHFARG